MWLFKKPTHERAWAPDYSRLTKAQRIRDGSWKLSDVRDWSYAGKDRVGEREWREYVITPANVTRAAFYINTFPILGIPDIFGHTFVGFEFEDGTSLACSIEARRQAGQTYMPIRGIFRAHELAFYWGTLNDFSTRRTVFQGTPLEEFEIVLPRQEKIALIDELLRQTEALHEKPRFYNTLVTNCTTELFRAIKKVAPEAMRWSLGWHVAKLTPPFLIERKIIAPKR